MAAASNTSFSSTKSTGEWPITPVKYGVPSVIVIIGDLAKVDLCCGICTIVDATDVPMIEGKAWRSMKTASGYYAISRRNGYTILMHRLLINAQTGEHVDHRHRNTLNNRRMNLRLATSVQNMANRAADKRNKLGVKGVSKVGNRYRATITPAGKQLHLGLYGTEAEAVAAYTGAAIAIWGEFARQK